MMSISDSERMVDAQRILFVDDDLVTLTLVRYILEEAYFDVDTANAGEDALYLIKLRRIPIWPF